MVGEDMSLRKRLSKSSESPEEKEDQGSPTQPSLETPTNGEFFILLKRINEIQGSRTGLSSL